jgi:N12 class adenine-specific DNA methylase
MAKTPREEVQDFFKATVADLKVRSTREEITDAVRRIEDFALEKGVTPNKDVAGSVHAYLSKRVEDGRRNAAKLRSFHNGTAPLGKSEPAAANNTSTVPKMAVATFKERERVSAFYKAKLDALPNDADEALIQRTAGEVIDFARKQGLPPKMDVAAHIRTRLQERTPKREFASLKPKAGGLRRLRNRSDEEYFSDVENDVRPTSSRTPKSNFNSQSVVTPVTMPSAEEIGVDPRKAGPSINPFAAMSRRVSEAKERKSQHDVRLVEHEENSTKENRNDTSDVARGYDGKEPVQSDAVPAHVPGGLGGPRDSGERRHAGGASREDSHRSLDDDSRSRGAADRGSGVEVSERRGGFGGRSDWGDNGGLGDRDRASSSPDLTSFRIDDDTALPDDDFVSRVRSHIDASALLKKLGAQGRGPTAEERVVLAGYMSANAIMGPMQHGVDDGYATYFLHRHQDLVRDLKNEIGAGEYSKLLLSGSLTSQALRTEHLKTLAAAMAKAGVSSNDRILIRGGDTRLPGLLPTTLGNGIITLMADDARQKRILEILYPQYEIVDGSISELGKPEGFYDVIVNLESSGIRAGQEGGFLLSRYLRHGGMMLAGANSGLMDSAQREADRQTASGWSNLKAAYRLPRNDLDGIQEAYDIMFLTKRERGRTVGEEAWWHESTVLVAGGHPVTMYFSENPSHITGKLTNKRPSYFRGATVTEDLDNPSVGRFSALVSKTLPDDILVPRTAVKRQSRAVISGEKPEYVPDGTFSLENGVLHVVKDGVSVPAGLPKTKTDICTRFVRIRDAYRDLALLLSEGIEEGRDEARKRLNDEYDAFVFRHGPMKSVRVNKNGAKSRPNMTPFRSDPDAHLVNVLEQYDERTDSANKKAIFTHDVIRKGIDDTFETENEAIEWSFNRYGYIDLEEIATHSGKTVDEVEGWLGSRIFFDPGLRRHITAKHYLSGNVGDKLDLAKSLAIFDDKYERHVAALEKAMPPRRNREDISAFLYASWLPTEVVKDFLRKHVDVTVAVTRNPIASSYKMTGGGSSRSAQSKWGLPASKEGAPAVLFKTIVEAALNHDNISIFTGEGKNRKYHAEQSDIANAKVRQLRDLFEGDLAAGIEPFWLQHEKHAEAVENAFNDNFRRNVDYDSEDLRLTFDGLAGFVTMTDGDVVRYLPRTHQIDSVRRAIQGGNLLIDHEVGLGKTDTAILSTMKLKQIGLAEKQLISVPNGHVQQWADRFMSLYPGAKVLIATKDNFSQTKKDEFLTAARDGDWDAIIIGHSHLAQIPNDPKSVEADLSAKVQELRDVHARCQGEERDSVDRELRKLERKLEKHISESKPVEGITFEGAGFDRLVLDECHEFKNAEIPTRHNALKGINGRSSAKARDLQIKSGHLSRKNPHYGMMFMSGTPLANSISEVYVWMNYLMPDELKAMNCRSFDAFLNNYAKIEVAMEISIDGRSMSQTERIRLFKNASDLMRMYRRVADVKVAQQVNEINRPVASRGPEIVVGKMSDDEWKIASEIDKRIDVLRASGGFVLDEDGNCIDSYLHVMAAAGKLAMDGRLVDDGLEFNPDGKIGKFIDVAAAHYIAQDGKSVLDLANPDRTQIAFCDYGTPGGSLSVKNDIAERVQETEMSEDDAAELAREADFYASDVSLYDDMKNRLIRKLVPHVMERDGVSEVAAEAKLTKEIAFIHDAKRAEEKQELSEAMNNGEVRFLFASTAKGSTGLNVQKRLGCIHHINPLYRPCDMEQRNGRIFRDGNLNKDVRQFNYVTEFSADAWRYQKIEDKSKFIMQFRTGSLSDAADTIEDIDDPTPGAAEMKAAAAGDSRMLDHAVLKSEVNSLKAQKKSHERVAVESRKNLAQTEERLHVLRDMKHVLDTEIGRFPASGDYDLKLNVPGLYPLPIGADGEISMEDVGKGIRRHLLENGVSMFSGNTTRSLHLGSVGDVKILADVRLARGGSNKQEYRIYFEGDNGQEYSKSSIDIDGLSSGWASLHARADWKRFAGRVFGAHDAIRAESRHCGMMIDRLNVDAESLRKTTETTVWPKMAVLKEATTKLNDLERDLERRPVTLKKPENSPVQSIRMTDTDFEFEWTLNGIPCDRDGNLIEDERAMAPASLVAARAQSGIQPAARMR